MKKKVLALVITCVMAFAMTACSNSAQAAAQTMSEDKEQLRALYGENKPKKTLASGISNSLIDEVYEQALNAGALGGKLLGAGGGGFLLFYVPIEKQENVKKAINLPQMPVAFDKQGSSVIYVGDKPDFI